MITNTTRTPAANYSCLRQTEHLVALVLGHSDKGLCLAHDAHSRQWEGPLPTHPDVGLHPPSSPVLGPYCYYFICVYGFLCAPSSEL